jgi:PhzF family phenazine biosynthesis protein
MRTGPEFAPNGWTQTCAPGRRTMLSPHNPTSRLTARNNFANRSSIWLLRLQRCGFSFKSAVPCKIMAIRIVQVDAFTNRPFAGNPAAVCVLREARDEQWMRDVAREMNLSETAFLVPKDDGYQLRWLTPQVEVDLCGHATVAAAHVLWQDGHLPEDRQARFYTRSGRLTADRRGEWIELDFPAKIAVRAEAPAELLPALGVAEAKFVGKNAFDYLVEVDSEATLRGLSPDHSRLRKLPVRGVIVTARSASPEFDFVSRFFAPGSGIDEDPVTGSAHTALGPYWASLSGRQEFTAFQASARGGVVRVRLEGDRVKLGGQAVTVMTGDLLA